MKVRAVIFSKFATIALFATALHAADNFPQWNYSVTVSIHTAPERGAVEGTVTQYPLLLRLTDPMIFNAAQPNGEDLRFSTLDEEYEFPYEIELWDRDNNTAIVWVLIPSIEGGTDNQQFLLHVGNGKAPAASDGNYVFLPDDGWVGVWHLKESITQDSDIAADATSLANHAVPRINGAIKDYNFPKGDGLIGKGQKLGTDKSFGRFFEVPQETSEIDLTGKAGDYTLSAWAIPADCPAESVMTLASKYEHNGWDASASYHLGSIGQNWSHEVFPPEYSGSEDPNMFSSKRNADADCQTSKAVFVSGVYQRYEGKQDDKQAEESTLHYVNGKLAMDGEAAHAIATGNPNQTGISAPFRIGGSGEGRFFRGTVDEVRASNLARSADWQKLDYETQRPAGNVAVTYSSTATRISTPGKARVQSAPVTARLSGGSTVFSVSGSAAGKLSVIDLQGRVVFSQEVSASRREVSWNTSAKGVFIARFTLKDAKVAYLDTRFSTAR